MLRTTDDIIMEVNMINVIDESLKISIDNKDQEAAYLLTSFVTERLGKCWETDNQKSFETLSRLPVWYFDYASSKLKESSSYENIFKQCSESSVNTFTGFLAQAMGVNIHYPEMEDTVKRKTFDLSSICFNRLSEVIHLCLDKKDVFNIADILKKISAISKESEGKRYELDFTVTTLKIKSRTEEENLKFKVLNKQKEFDDRLKRMIRILFKVSYYWVLYLDYKYYFNATEFKTLTEAYEKYSEFLNEDFYNDILFLKEYNPDGFSYWELWGYGDSDTGTSHVSSSEWISISVALYLINQDEKRLLINSAQANKSIQKRYDFIKELQGIFNFFLQSPPRIWKGRYQEDTEVVRGKIDKIREYLEMEMRKYDIQIQEKINKAPIDKEKKDTYLGQIKSGWYETDTVRAIFEYHEKIRETKIKEPGEPFRRIGIVNNLLDGWRSAIIGGNDAIPVFGIEKYGQYISDKVVTHFLRTIFNSQTIYKTSSLFQDLDSFIIHFRNEGKIPTLILVDHEVYTKYIRSGPSKKYQENSTPPENFPTLHFGGYYDEIPIVYFLNIPLLRDKVILADFKSAFSLIQNKASDDNVLCTRITEITDNNLQELFGEDSTVYIKAQKLPSYKLELINSLILDAYVMEYFEINDQSAYKIIELIRI